MSTETNTQATTGADAIDQAIAKGIDFDGSLIPKELEIKSQTQMSPQ